MYHLNEIKTMIEKAQSINDIKSDVFLAVTVKKEFVKQGVVFEEGDKLILQKKWSDSFNIYEVSEFSKCETAQLVEWRLTSAEHIKEFSSLAITVDELRDGFEVDYDESKRLNDKIESAEEFLKPYQMDCDGIRTTGGITILGSLALLAVVLSFYCQTPLQDTYPSFGVVALTTVLGVFLWGVLQYFAGGVIEDTARACGTHRLRARDIEEGRTDIKEQMKQRAKVVLHKGACFTTAGAALLAVTFIPAFSSF